MDSKGQPQPCFWGCNGGLVWVWWGKEYTIFDTGFNMNSPPSHQPYPPHLRAFAKTMRNNPTNSEYKLWRALKGSQIGVKFRRQQQFGGKYIADFTCFEPKIIIEIDGATHSREHEIVRDSIRDEYFISNGWEVIRVQSINIQDNIGGFLDFLRQRIWELSGKQERKIIPHS